MKEGTVCDESDGRFCCWVDSDQEESWKGRTWLGSGWECGTVNGQITSILRAVANDSEIDGAIYLVYYFCSIVDSINYKITTMDAEQGGGKEGKKGVSGDLLKLEKPIYQLKRNEEGKVESLIAKLMLEKQKPQIGFLPRSQLLDQLQQFMPVLQQANQQLLTHEIKPEMRIDAKMETVEDSSSSEDEDEQADEMQEVQAGEAGLAGEGEAEDEMVDEAEQQAQLQSCGQFQFNILTYPYLKEAEAKQQTKPQAKQVGVVEMGEQTNELQRMQ